LLQRAGDPQRLLQWEAPESRERFRDRRVDLGEPSLKSWTQVDGQRERDLIRHPEGRRHLDAPGHSFRREGEVDSVFEIELGPSRGMTLEGLSAVLGGREGDLARGCIACRQEAKHARTKGSGGRRP
jgi:hypothetical protein